MAIELTSVESPTASSFSGIVDALIASDIEYDNTASGLVGDDVQEALDELAAAVGTLSPLTFKGLWNATTNAPPLASGTGTSGDTYRVSVAGGTDLDGETDWQIGDWVVFDGATNTWQKIDNTDRVTSVNGEAGTVVLDAADIGYNNVASGLAAADVQAAIDELDGSIDSLQTAIAGLQSASGNASLWLSWEEDSSGPTLNVITGEIRGWVLPNTTTTGISTQIVTPKAMDTSTNPTLQIPLWVHMTGAASANVRLRLEARYIANGEQVDKTVDETILQTFPVTNTGDELHLTSFTLTGSLIALSDTINLHLERLGSDAADTFTGQIAIVKSARFDYSEAV